MKNFTVLLAIVSFFIFPPISIIIIIAIVVKSFLDYKRVDDYALSALTAKYIYDNMSEKEKAKIDHEANHFAYEQYIKGTSLEAGMDYDEIIKLSERTLMRKKRIMPWGYWLFLVNVFVKLQIPNPFGDKWYQARLPFKELEGKEKYEIKGMQDFLRDKYQIEVNINESSNTNSVPATKEEFNAIKKQCKEEFGINITDQAFEDHNFKINSDGWKKITRIKDKSYLENPKRDIWEIIDGECAGEQLFTWDAAIRETAKAGKRIPTDDEFTEMLKTKSDMPDLVFSGFRSTNSLFYDRDALASFWSSTESGANALGRSLCSGDATVNRNMSDKAYGSSVRCLKN